MEQWRSNTPTPEEPLAMLGTIVLLMLLLWFSTTVWMTVRAGDGSQLPEDTQRAQHVTTNAAPMRSGASGAAVEVALASRS